MVKPDTRITTIVDIEVLADCHFLRLRWPTNVIDEWNMKQDPFNRSQIALSPPNDVLFHQLIFPSICLPF